MIDLSFLDRSLWLCEPQSLQKAVARVLAFKTCPTRREVVEMRQKEMLAAKNVGSMSQGSGRGRVGVIPITGPLGQRMSAELDKSGGTSCDFISAALSAVLADSSIGNIVLHVDSPGGSSYGIQEVGEQIYDGRKIKPITAMIDSMGCSAALWLASQATSVSISPGADTGSLGVYIAHADQSRAMDLEGVKITFVHAGRHKVDGHPFAPLGDDARAHLQAMVDETYSKFLSAVARGRGKSAATVAATFGQGRVVSANEARRVGMVDKIETFQQLMARLQGGSTPGGRYASASGSSEMRKLRREQGQRVQERLRLEHRLRLRGSQWASL